MPLREQKALFRTVPDTQTEGFSLEVVNRTSNNGACKIQYVGIRTFPLCGQSNLRAALEFEESLKPRKLTSPLARAWN